jgi:hypothetical protein
MSYDEEKEARIAELEWFVTNSKRLIPLDTKEGKEWHKKADTLLAKGKPLRRGEA